jgi:Predicted membrane protein (DUF2254)
MSWGVLFRIREYRKGSLWFFPLIGPVLGPLAALIVHQADTHVTLPAGWQYTPSTASTLLTTIIGATVALFGFVVTVSVRRVRGRARLPGPVHRRNSRVAVHQVFPGVPLGLAFTCLLAAFLTQVGALQTAPILIAVITVFLTMEGVKYLVASRKQARAAAAKQTASAGRAQRRRRMTRHPKRSCRF